jgi:hypothetical protein
VAARQSAIGEADRVRPHGVQSHGCAPAKTARQQHRQQQQQYPLLL